MAKSIHPYSVPRPAGSMEGLDRMGLRNILDLTLTDGVVGQMQRNPYDSPKPASSISAEHNTSDNKYTHMNGGSLSERTYSNISSSHASEVHNFSYLLSMIMYN